MGKYKTRSISAFCAAVSIKKAALRQPLVSKYLNKSVLGDIYLTLEILGNTCLGIIEINDIIIDTIPQCFT